MFTLKTRTICALAFVAAQALLCAGGAQAQAPAPAADQSASAVLAAPEHAITGNVGLVSDYRFRGISQTWRQPAVQGGLDYVHRSGLYLGTWASNVSGNSYNNGSALEWDLYGGVKLEVAPGVVLDLGALAYIYPGARMNRALGVVSTQKYDNVDLYVGVSHGPFSAKLSYAVTDYFGLNGSSAGYAYFSSLAPHGGSRGSLYLDLNYNVDLGQGVTLGLHAGHVAVRNYADLSYSDAKVSVSKEVFGVNLSVAIVGTNAKSAYYQAGNAAGADAKRLGKAALVLGLSKGF